MSDEAHRLACEVRYIRRMTEHDRQAFMALVAKHRGEEAARRLAELVAGGIKQERSES